MPIKAQHILLQDPKKLPKLEFLVGKIYHLATLFQIGGRIKAARSYTCFNAAKRRPDKIESEIEIS
jgi:hypothetical protein